MRHCDACGRDFRRLGRSMTCPYCGFNTNPRAYTPRSKASLELIEKRRREEQEMERELREYFDVAHD